MEANDFSIFSIDDLEELKQNALNTYKLIKRQIAGIPESSIPTLKQIELNNLETKIKLYEEAINLKLGLKEKATTNEKSYTNDVSQKIYDNADNNDFIIKKMIQKKAVKIFISYAHADEQIKDELIEHLLPLKQIGKLEYWEDRAIRLGDKWDEEIKKGLKEAEIIMLLVSPKSLASMYINDVELKIAFDRCKRNEAILIPVIVTDVFWQILEIGEYQVAPKDGVPIDSKKWNSKNAAYLNIVKQLNDVIDKIFSYKTS